MSTIEVKVPDIGDFKDVPVIEVFVKPGDVVKPEDPLATLESDKATMDVPAPAGGTVREVRIKVGDKVSEGSVMLVLDATAAAAAAIRDEGQPLRAAPGYAPPAEAGAPSAGKGHEDVPGEGATTTPPARATVEVRVPDIGDFTEVPVIDVFVKPGDVVNVDDPLVTLESDSYPEPWMLWSLCWVHTAASIANVYLRLAQRTWKVRPPLPVRLRAGRTNLLRHAGGLLAAVAFAGIRHAPWAALVPFVPPMLDAVHCVLRAGLGVRPAHVGIRQMVVMILFVALMVAAWR